MDLLNKKALLANSIWAILIKFSYKLVIIVNSPFWEDRWFFLIYIEQEGIIV